ncbi:hypothetical protein [Devosia sp.]|uniref:hypothetical protein n=1 Tax=Devosia sp. TaxID=1871048 RepID=UPI002AFF6797|nr:hypothetical protein [Devosia sp.]
MRHCILLAATLTFAITGPSAANPLVMEYLARDPAVLTCAAVALPTDTIDQITDIKLVRNFVTIEYVSNGRGDAASCYFEKSSQGFFEISYDEHLKAAKENEVGLLLNISEVTRTVNRYKSLARPLPFYPISSSETMLGDVRR